MQFIPWKYIANWKCISCGDCCKLYSVVLNFEEWLGIVKNYGVERTVSGLDKLFINRNSDGSCSFLNNGSNICTCGLQRRKPRACQLWPFKVLMSPRFGNPSDALYVYHGTPLFVYADSMCRGLRLGRPGFEFANYTVQEFVEIAVGIRRNQLRTTAEIGFSKPYYGIRFDWSSGFR